MITLKFTTRPVEGCDHDHHHHHSDQHLPKTDDAHLHDDLQHLRNLTVIIEDDDYIIAECGARSLSAPMMKKDQERMKEWSVERSKNVFKRNVIKRYEIPVYVHVLQSGILSGRVPTTRIMEYMNYLNAAFSGSKNGNPFVFRLVKTTRTINARWTDGCGDVGIEREFKGKLRVGGAESLNVYFCDAISNGRGGFFAGYAYPPFPASDSFVRDGIVLAKSDGESRLNTFVHEAVSNAEGSWFCHLRRVWTHLT